MQNLNTAKQLIESFLGIKFEQYHQLQLSQSLHIRQSHLVEILQSARILLPSAFLGCHETRCRYNSSAIQLMTVELKKNLIGIPVRETYVCIHQLKSAAQTIRRSATFSFRIRHTLLKTGDLQIIQNLSYNVRTLRRILVIKTITYSTDRQQQNSLTAQNSIQNSLAEVR